MTKSVAYTIVHSCLRSDFSSAQINTTFCRFFTYLRAPMARSFSASHSCILRIYEMIRLSTCFCALLLASFVSAAPAGTSVPAPVSPAVPSSSAAAVSSVSVLSSAAHTSTTKPTTTVKPSPTSAGGEPVVPHTTRPGIDLDPGLPLWNEGTTEQPEPIRGFFGAKLLGPLNVPIDKQNPDLLAPPNTDHGSM